jgi:aminopeptidase-like protein
MKNTIHEWDFLTTQADRLLKELFPICRSITGEGTRQTLRKLCSVTNFQLFEIPSGTACYDWTIPDEWNVQDAFVADSSGHRVIDFKINNIHLVSYSIPFEGVLTYEELAPHLHTLPDLPNAIPYRTTYYHKDWGFCLTHDQLQKMDRTGSFHVVVDTTLAPGSLTYGEATLPGTSGQEYLITTYVCHPSLANDNLSGVILWTLLLREIRQVPHRHSYRFVIAPETIGALAYISRNEAVVKTLAGGLVVTTVAGPGKIGYKSTWRGDSLIDRAVRSTFRELDLEFVEYPFDASGSDERQYSSPGLRIPMGTICKDKYYEYPYYHTSLDNLDFIRADALIETLKVYLSVIEKLEQNQIYRSLNPIGEPMLGKRGLYPRTGGALRQKVSAPTPSVGELDAIRWILFYADGKTSLHDIAEITGLPLQVLTDAAVKLIESDLIVEV